MTAQSYRPRRSVLYMPGANARALEKAAGLNADALIFDLEDAVAPGQKIAARETIHHALKTHDYGCRERIVRINTLASEWGKDDASSFANSADGIAIPKVETAEEVLAVIKLLESADDHTTQIWAMIETPLGVLNALQIAQSHSRLSVLVMGTNDLSKELRIPQLPDRAGFMVSFGLCILAARAAGVDILDGVYIDLNDDAGLHAACEQGRELGFDGKTLIHPKQLAPCNQAFSPSLDALEDAQKIVAAGAQAKAEGLGVVLMEGRLVEDLHVIAAQRLIDIAAAIKARS